MSKQSERNARRLERDGVKKAPSKKKTSAKKKTSSKKKKEEVKISEEVSPEGSSAEDKKVEKPVELDAFDG